MSYRAGEGKDHALEGLAALEDMPSAILRFLNLPETLALTCVSLHWRAVFASLQHDVKAARSARRGSHHRCPLISALVVFERWRGSRWRWWCNSIVGAAVRFHPFAHRLECNLPAVARHFVGGISSLARVHSRKRFVGELHVARCPECRSSDASMALYFSVGMKAIRSTPYLSFGCRSCLQELYNSNALMDNWYDAPRVCVFTQPLVWLDPLVWLEPGLVLDVDDGT